MHTWHSAVHNDNRYFNIVNPGCLCAKVHAAIVQAFAENISCCAIKADGEGFCCMYLHSVDRLFYVRNVCSLSFIHMVDIYACTCNR